MSIGGFFIKPFRAVGRVLAFIRATVANLIVLGIVAAIALAIFSGRTKLPEQAALLLAPTGAVVEQEVLDPFALLGAGLLEQTRLDDMLRAIRQAGDDDRISALVFDPSSLGQAPPATLEALGDALAAFRETGKRIVATSRSYERDQYYLASFADDIYLHPLGEVMLGGYGMYGNYYRGLFDKLKINVHVFRVGSYKAFVEPYTRADMSPTAREANQGTVDALWARFVARVAENRDLTPEAVRAYANNYDEWVVAAAAGGGAEAALNYGLVDGLLTDAEVTARLRELTGGERGDHYHRVAFEDYLQPRLPAVFGDAVAVITASGAIVTGDPPPGFVGADDMATLLGDVRRDAAVKAVVLRIDSGGGSMLASEIIRREVIRVQQAGKPVVVSMGGTAASGGYWIGATADEIWAAPTTLTGSIGVFAIVPTFEDALDEVGVTWDGVRTGPFVGALDPFGGVGEAMARALQANVDYGYRQFVEIVAAGRDMTVEQVRAVAEGRVWTGEQALEHGLVDKLGHLQDAVASAAALAELDQFVVRYVKEPLSPKDMLLRALAEDFDVGRVRGTLAAHLAREIKLLDTLADPKHVYALCELCGGLR